MNKKSPLKSKTLIGALVMIIAFSLSQFGFDVTTSELTGIVTKTIDVINTIIFIFGAFMTIYGRFRARKQLRVPGKQEQAALMLLVCVSLILPLTACGEQSAKRAAQGTYLAAVGIDQGIALKRYFAAQGEITPDGELRITRSLLVADRGLLQITDTAECFESYTADTRDALVQGVADGITALDQLNQQGVIHFKSEEAQRHFAIAITTLRSGAVALKMTLALLPARGSQTKGGPESPLSDKERQALEQVRQLCRSASTILRQNEHRLAEDLARLEHSS